MIGRIGRAIGKRLRSVRYVLGDLAFLVSRPFRALGRRIRPAWQRVPATARRRAGAAIGLVAVAALGAFVITPNLPCSFPGGDTCAPDDEAIEIVPADALAYLHANIDPGTDQYEKATELAGRTPLISRAVIAQALPLLVSSGQQPTSFGDDIQPWFGGELALAVVPSVEGNQQVQLLEVTDAEGADAYAQSLVSGQADVSDHQGVEVSEDARGLASAQTSGFLILGPAPGVRSVIDVAENAEDADPLSGEKVATDALDELPDERLAEAYLSEEGIDSYLALAEGPLSPVEPLVDSGIANGAAFSVTGTDEGFDLAVRSILDPDREEDAGGFFAAFDRFEPELTERLAPDTLAYFGLGDANETVETLLGQATVRAPGIAQGFTSLIADLRREADVDIGKDLLPAIAGEGAFAVVPRPQAEPENPADSLPDPGGAELPGSEDEPGEPPQPGDIVPPQTIAPADNNVPYLEFLGSDVDEEEAREALARLARPLSRSADPDLGSPSLREETFGSIEAQVLQLSPVASFVYATFESTLAVANDTASIERLAAGGDSLADSDAYGDAVDGLPEDPAFITYLDLGGLLAYAEANGLAESPAYGGLAPDLRLLRTFALTVAEEEDVLSTDAKLRISER